MECTDAEFQAHERQIEKMSLWASSSAARSGRNARTYDQSTSQIIDLIKVIADVEDEELDE